MSWITFPVSSLGLHMSHSWWDTKQLSETTSGGTWQMFETQALYGMLRPMLEFLINAQQLFLRYFGGVVATQL